MNEQMTDFQFRRLLEMVLAILKKSDNLEEAIAEIEKLAAKETGET